MDCKHVFVAGFGLLLRSSSSRFADIPASTGPHLIGSSTAAQWHARLGWSGIPLRMVIITTFIQVCVLLGYLRSAFFSSCLQSSSEIDMFSKFSITPEQKKKDGLQKLAAALFSDVSPKVAAKSSLKLHCPAENIIKSFKFNSDF